MWKPTHEDTVSCQLTHVTGTEFPHLSSNAVLLHQRLLGTHTHTHTQNVMSASTPLVMLTVGFAQSDTNFLQADLGKVELQRIISGQRDYEASGQVLRQWVAMVTEEQAVVTQWWHGNANLSQVVKILQHWGLTDNKQRESMRDKRGFLYGIVLAQYYHNEDVLFWTKQCLQVKQQFYLFRLCTMYTEQ